jgi:hypothetical protein
VFEKLRANNRIARLMGQPVGPQSVAIRRQDLPAVLNAIREMGLLPLFEGHEKDTRP